MDITKYEVYGGVNLGLYATAGNGYLLVPKGFAESKADTLASRLEVDWHAISVCGTRLLGAMLAHNDFGMVLPKTIQQSEYEVLREVVGDNVTVLDVRYTALGNLVCANNRGAVVSPLFNGRERSAIQDALGVETVIMGISGYDQSGVLATGNGSGTVVHPMADEEELRRISEILGTRVEPSTINNGVPFVASGVLANDTSVVVGRLTTGPEIMMLTRAFMG